MRFNSRVIHDPYYGHGVDLDLTATSGVSYGTGFSIGVTDSLFKINLTLTPPFDTNRLNTFGREDSVGGYSELGLKVCFLWLQVSLNFYRHDNRSWFSGIFDEVEALDR